MKTEQEHFLKNQRGSGLVYVLIAVALFGALSFTLMRSNDSNEADTMPDDKAELYATQLISYAAQAKTVVDQMYFTGTDPDELDFSLPGTAAFNAAPHIHKIYHPEGGGLNAATLPTEVQYSAGGGTAPGWYGIKGMLFELLDSSTNSYVVLSAYKINLAVCTKINEKISGSSTVSAAPDLFFDFFQDGGFGLDFEVSDCPTCEGHMSYCFQDQAGNYSFYNALAKY